MNFSTAANVLRRSARPHESFMGASASAGHHLAAAEKEAGVGGGAGVGGVAQSRSCSANGGNHSKRSASQRLQIQDGKHWRV